MRSTIIVKDIPSSLEGTVLELVEADNPTVSSMITGDGVLHVIAYDGYNILVDLMVSEYVVDSDRLKGWWWEAWRVLKTQPS